MALRRFWPAALLVGLPLIWWWPLLTGMLPDFMDTVTQLYPMRVAAARQLHGGTLPLWLPNMLGGTPLAADPQVAVWYPLSWLFFAHPTPFVNGVVCLLHYLLAGFGMYALCRCFGIGRGSSVFGTFVLQFGAFMVSRLALTPLLFAGAWIPWLLWSVERAIASGHRRHAALTGGLLACQILAGSPQISFYTGGLLLFWFCGRGWQRGRLTSAVRQGAVAALLAMLIAAIQLLPTAEFLRESERHGIPEEKLREGGLNGPYRWRAITGGFDGAGEDTDTTHAIGLGALALVPLALVRRRLRPVGLLALGISLVFYLLALGSLTPLWARVLPLYGNFHAPRRALVVWAMLGPFLAAMGAETVRGWLLRAGPRGLGGTLAGAILALLALGNVMMLPRLERAFTSSERFDPLPEYAAAIGSDRFLTIDPSFRYSYDSRRWDYGPSMMPNLASWHGLYDAQGYNPLVLARAGRLRYALTQSTGYLYPSHGVFLTDPASPALRLLAVQYLVGRYDLFDPRRLSPDGEPLNVARVEALLEPVSARSWRWPLHRYRESRPLAWAVARTEPRPDAESALRAALEGDPWRVAFIEEGGPAFDFGPPPGVEVRRTSATSFHLRLGNSPDFGAFVCLSNIWAPGWIAEAGGRRWEPVPVAGTITGVLIPPSVREFDVVYRPVSFRLGVMLSLLGLLGLVVCVYRI